MDQDRLSSFVWHRSMLQVLGRILLITCSQMADGEIPPYIATLNRITNTSKLFLLLLELISMLHREFSATGYGVQAQGAVQTTVHAIAGVNQSASSAFSNRNNPNAQIHLHYSILRFTAVLCALEHSGHVPRCARLSRTRP